MTPPPRTLVVEQPERLAAALGMARVELTGGIRAAELWRARLVSAVDEQVASAADDLETVDQVLAGYRATLSAVDHALEQLGAGVPSPTPGKGR